MTALRLASIAAVSVLATGGTIASMPAEPRTSRTTAWCASSDTSRWSAHAADYRRTGTYGLTDGDWLMDVTGLAAIGNRVFVHDAPAARIHVLDSSLELVHRFGRKGDGPGELQPSPMLRMEPYQHHLVMNSLTVDDTLVYAYDGRSIQAFRFDGTHIDRVATVRGRMGNFTVGKLQATRHGMMWSFDSLDIRGTGERRLQTWRARGGAASLVHSARLPPMPVRNGRHSGTNRDPRPLWAAFNHCLAWADGVSHRVVRTDLAAATADTIILPPHDVPPDNHDPKTAARLAEGMGAPPPIPRPRDAPLWHWSSLVADPDGHLWVRPWTWSLTRLDVPVYRIDPGGRVHEETLPDFPMAFGPPGVFYTRERHPETDEIHVVRWERRSP